ncbi:MAG: hypothetical protein LW710_04485 [Burkholderiales bacterium]|uniref:hypothetical protein n=1 Tax=Limnobacter sp. TaxID=2003368 RepID=UPI0039BC78EA|nr:hypothetical protein [Burkholderiales bacterium]
MPNALPAYRHPSLSAVDSVSSLQNTERSSSTPTTPLRKIAVSTAKNTGNSLQSICHKAGNIARALINRLKNIDGIDETAASLALIRGVTGPIAAEAVFAAGLPFVVLGFVGMMEESAEARNAVLDLLQDKKELAQQARQIADKRCKLNLNDRRQIQELKNEIKLRLAGLPQQQQIEKSKAYVQLFAKLHGLNQQQTEKLLLRCAAPFGTFALGAMTAGMLPGLAWGAAEIGVRTLGQTTPETAAQVGSAPLAAQVSASAGTAISMVFAPANAAMVAYSALRGLAGIQKNRVLEKSRVQANLSTQNEISALGKKIFNQYSRAEMRSNRWTHTHYGVVTATGQSALAASGGLAIAGFFGAAAATAIGTGGIALPVAGAAAAVGAAALRIRGEVAEEIRHGDPELPEIKNRPRIGQEIFIEETGETFLKEPDELTSQEIDQHLTQAHKDLARDKLVSLAFSAISQHASMEGRQNAMKHWVVELGARKGKMIGSGTSLLPETVEELRKLFYSDEVQNTLNDAFCTIAPGAASQTLLSLAGYPDLPSVLNELDDTQLETICRKMAPDFVKPLSQLQAQEKLISLVLKAKQSASSPEQAMRNLKQQIYLTEKGWRTTLPQPARRELKALFETLSAKKTFTEQSALERILQTPGIQTMHAELQQAGLNTENLFEKTAGKGNYTVNVQTLMKLCKQSASLNNRLYELAAPMLIQQLKNDSKVRMNQAFELMGSSLLRDNESREFAKTY